MHSPSRYKAAQADHTRAPGNADLDEMNRVVKELSLLPPAPASHETLGVECRRLRDYPNALHESIATDDATLRRDARRLLDVQAWPSQDATRSTWAAHRMDLGRLARNTCVSPTHAGVCTLPGPGVRALRLPRTPRARGWPVNDYPAVRCTHCGRSIAIEPPGALCYCGKQP
ncbi:hypothetical protein QIS99_04375 [Streptomyces sp. B-S-A8]|uniref:Uncharacterized protein n=1 Tax=Streptomyces solicavernae TaxID=3043614 RepID=A0ABT6RLZ5_9ACTN|nr:hypothetical protein [Streptomyces sp. B-S-A8]MDI3385453.1 hypothetical protein [Streptomyces sp. B-S-A8]